MKTLRVDMLGFLRIKEIIFRNILFLIPVLLLGIPIEGISGNITGTVVNIKDGTPLENVDVFFFDALNAELLGSSTTGALGVYNSGIIPDGEYRVRFEKSYFHNEYHGAGGTTEFCAASVIQVQSDSATIVNEEMVPSGIVIIFLDNIALAGTVSDASTLLPLQGIQVSSFDGYDGDLLMVATTDSYGQYSMRHEMGSHPVKLRYADPSGIYFPEYHGAENTDSFCSGAEFNDHYLDLEGFMDRIPLEEAVRAIVDKLESFNLPNNVTKMLGTPIIRTVDLLTDSNPNNDVAVCNQMASFISRVDIQEKNGHLTTAEADELRQLAEALRVELGC